ncbi:MAG TPA: PfkB family carbohydrate kinase [Magnetospirillaceae bacterium]
MAADSVLVIGDVITDVIVQPHGPITWGSDTRADIRPMPGGSGPNQAAWLGIHGIHTLFIGRAGVHDLGVCEAELRDFGVEPILAGDEKLATGMLVTIIAPDGERSFLTDRGANRNLCRGDLSDHLLHRLALLHISGYSLFEPGPRGAILDFAKKARGMGVQVTVDPASAGFLREVGPADFLAWTSGLHMCFPNAEEAELLTGTGDHEQQMAKLAAHYSVVAIKRGRGGADLGDATGARLHADAKPVSVIDTIGAGDAFYAGFIAGYLRGHPLQTCLEDGVAAGTRATTILGGRPPRPDRSHP